MKLTFRDLKKNTFVIEAEPSALVGDVKKQVADNQSAEVPQIRLIYSGKVLGDDKSIESYGVKESDHIICMVQKPKTKVSSEPAPSTPAPAAPAETPSVPNAPLPAAVTRSDPDTPTPPGSQPPSASRRFDDTSPMMGPERQAAIANMESMGFARTDIEAAMRAAFWNADRAVEFLLNGIPENLQQEASATARPPTQQQPSQATAPPPPAATTTQPSSDTQESGEPVNLFEAAAAQQRGGSGSGAAATAAAGTETGATQTARGQGGQANPGNLDFLRENPMFQQLRGLVQAQPNMLENVLQQVTAANPQLAQLISQNPDQFLQLLSEGDEGDIQLPPGTREISVSEEERDAIERLCNLGFERDMVIQAYFACDKNEELAANFLFDQPPDEDAPPGDS